jgi:hypothetical protein
VGFEAFPPVLLECLKRVGSESLLVNGGRGMLATSTAYAAVATRNLLGLAAVAKNCLICRAARLQSCLRQ